MPNRIILENVFRLPVLSNWIIYAGCLVWLFWREKLLISFLTLQNMIAFCKGKTNNYFYFSMDTHQH